MILCVVGARPNFVKMAPVIHALMERKIQVGLVHTGQHYDRSMSDVFFHELNLPPPDLHFCAGGRNPAQQTAFIMELFEKACFDLQPRLVVVAGDVNSTMACAVAASRLRVPLAHVESGLRSFDRSMIEEVNRVVTDHLSDMLFVTEKSACENLLNEGISEEKIYFAGNTMIDTLMKHLPEARKRAPWKKYGMQPGAYALATLHRPENVDQGSVLESALTGFGKIAGLMPVLFPVHPRTRLAMSAGRLCPAEGVYMIDPAEYLDFLGLLSGAKMVLTDSGGVQEESTALGVPCLTLRNNTERPVTVDQGTNVICGSDPEKFVKAAVRIIQQRECLAKKMPDLWDGRAGERIADTLARYSLSLAQNTELDNFVRGAPV